MVLQNNIGNKYSPTIIIAPLTEVLKKETLPTHIKIPKTRFLKYDSMILLEQIRTIDKVRIKSYLGKLQSSQLQEIDNSLIKTLSINIIGYLLSLWIGDCYDMKNYIVTIISNNKKQNVQLKAKNKKESKEMVANVLLNCELFGVKSLENIKLKSNRIRRNI